MLYVIFNRQNALQLLNHTRSVSPIGALAIFLLAYLAFLVGHFAAAVVVAFLIGLHYANKPLQVQVNRVPVGLPQPTTAAVQTAIAPPAVVSSPIVDAITAGLQVRKIELGQPAAVKPKKQTA